MNETLRSDVSVSGPGDTPQPFWRKVMQRTVSRIGGRTLRLMMREMEQGAFEAMDWTVPVWAAKAKVSSSTVYRLLNGNTRFPQFETIVRLAHAVHTDVIPHESGSVELRLKRAPTQRVVFSERGL